MVNKKKEESFLWGGVKNSISGSALKGGLLLQRTPHNYEQILSGPGA